MAVPAKPSCWQSLLIPAPARLPAGLSSTHPCSAHVPCPPCPPSPTPACCPSPPALWIQFLLQQPMSKWGPRGSPSATTNCSSKHPSQWPGLVRSLCTPARAVTCSPAGCPFYGHLQKKPPPNSWQVADGAGKHSGKGDVWVLVLPGGFWLLWVWEEGGIGGRGSGDNTLPLAIRGLNALR